MITPQTFVLQGSVAEKRSAEALFTYLGLFFNPACMLLLDNCFSNSVKMAIRGTLLM